MSELIRYTLAAERSRGCYWADKFGSAALVRSNGGTITGAPTFSASEGVALDGVNDYVTYDVIANQWEQASEISFLMEFTPNFAHTGPGATRQFFDGFPSTERYTLYILSNGNLGLFCGATVIATIPLANYTNYWNAYSRNSIFISSESGNTSVWLNGFLILDSDATVWTPGSVTALKIGSRHDGANKFKGTIHRFRVFKSKLTDQEAVDYCNGTVFDYLQDAVVNLPMRLEDHDPVNTRTLDRSGNGRHGTLVAGVTKNTRERGYFFDGTDDAISIPHDSGLNFTDGLTVACWIKHDPTQAGVNVRYIVGKGPNVTGMPFAVTYDLNVGAPNEVEWRLWDGAANKTAVIADLYDGQWISVVGTFDGQTLILYINAVEVVRTAFPAATTLDTNSDPVTIGDTTPSAREFKGDESDVKLWNRPLTPMQIIDMFQAEQRGRHRI